MANKKKWLGKVLKNINGYNVRQMGTNKVIRINGGDKSVFAPSNTLGVYTGRKKLIKEGFKQVKEAIEFIKTI